MFRKRKPVAPLFRLPVPLNPISGEYAALRTEGVFPHSAIVQVAKEDTEDNYVTCRGFDPRISKFIDYASGDPNKPGIPVAKPYGKRYPGVYRVAEVYQALLPLQTTNPSPSDVEWRVRQNPGYAVGGGGHPYDLSEKIDELYNLEGKLINYMLVDDGSSGALDAIIAFTCLTDRTREVDARGNFGRSTVLITDKVGIAGDAIGETVTAVFGDSRWLETVAGCQGMAIYQYDAERAAELGLDDPWLWIVFECQGLTAGFWCETLEDRNPFGAPVQDVLVTVVQQTGHANDDFPRENWHTGSGECSGSAVWTRAPQGTSWTNTIPCDSGCMSKQDPNELILSAAETTRHVASDWAGQPPALPRLANTSHSPLSSSLTLTKRVPQPIRNLIV